MIRDFLTLEDVNTVNYSNQRFWWHEIDCSKLPDGEFTDLKVDFCRITKEEYEEGGLKHWMYTVKVDNCYWAKGAVGHYGTSRGIADITIIDDNKFTVNHEDYQLLPQFYIMLYMGTFPIPSPGLMSIFLLDNEFSLNLKELQSNQTIRIGEWVNPSIIESVTQKLEVGYNFITYNVSLAGYCLVNLVKTDFQFTCNQSLTVGKVNKVYLGTDSDYLPDGDLVGEYTPTITIDYNGETLPVTFDGTDYYFNLDLSEKTEIGKVRFTVNVESNEVLNSTSTDVALNSQYETVNTFNAFLNAVRNNELIRVGANLTATSNIPVEHSIKIIGNDKTLNLNGYGFQLKEDIEFKAENIQFNNGDTTILQRPNTIVDLTNVTFTNCTSNNYNNLGGCIFCDTDYPSLTIENDFQTTLTDCLFTNNNTAIFHGGQLTMDKCRFHNNNTSYADVNNAGFLYQVDGDARISNCVFDIDYDTDQYCSDEENIDYAQALFMCGETATINGYGYTDLTGNNLNGFFDAPQNNRSHIFAKYYYPQIETCVYTSPISNNEDKCFCYGLSGEDYIYKINAQVTRADSGNENTTRKIGW